MMFLRVLIFKLEAVMNTIQISRNLTPMVMLEMGSPLETPLHSSSKTGSVKMKTKS